MAGCGGCSKRRAARDAARKAKHESYDVMGGYKNLPDRQIKARLEVYKKIHCKGCGKRYKCNYEMYLACKK